MAFFGKTYTLVKNEGYLEWLLSTGIPEDRAKAMDSGKPSQSFVQNGDGSYTTTSTSTGASRSTTFKSGVEIDDVIGDDNLAIKSTYVVDGNTINQVFKSARGTVNIKREFKGDDLEVTITSDKYDGVAKRYYKA